MELAEQRPVKEIYADLVKWESEWSEKMGMPSRCARVCVCACVLVCLCVCVCVCVAGCLLTCSRARVRSFDGGTDMSNPVVASGMLPEMPLPGEWRARACVVVY